MIKFITDIEEHFREEYPREGCGLLVVEKGKLKWIPCKNKAEEKENFIFDSKEYISIAKQYDITGIVHSHPDSSPEPSQVDIDNCNALGIPYYIFSYPEMEMYLLHPDKKEKPLYGREYKFGVQDCFEAVRDYYMSTGLVVNPRLAFEDNWWTKNLDYFTDYINENDMLLFNVYSMVPNHCGVYIGNDLFYHHAANRLSCRENLYPTWHKYITGVYRYAV